MDEMSILRLCIRHHDPQHEWPVSFAATKIFGSTATLLRLLLVSTALKNSSHGNNHPRSGHLKSMDPTSHSSGWLVDKRTLRKSTSSGSFGDFLVGVNEPGLIASWKNVNPSNVDSIPWFIIIFLNFSVATLEVSPPVLWEICRYPHR